MRQADVPVWPGSFIPFTKGVCYETFGRWGNLLPCPVFTVRALFSAKAAAVLPVRSTPSGRSPANGSRSNSRMNISCRISSASVRPGNSLLIHGGTAYTLFDRASVLFQFNGKFQGYADAGITDEPKENTGGTWLFADPGIGIQPAGGLSGSA
jgi:hypothetical protein